MFKNLSKLQDLSCGKLYLEPKQNLFGKYVLHNPREHFSGT